MKAILVAIDAKFTQSNLAVRCLRNYWKKNNKSPSISLALEEFTINQPIHHIVTQLYLENADVYLFSSYIWNIEEIKSVISDLKKVLPKAKFFVGGPEASYQTDALWEDLPLLDGILLGEGEATLTELLHFLNEDKSLSACAGLSLLTGPTAPRPPLPMDDLPFPYEDLEVLEHRTLYYESMRGCPFSCSYCLSSVEQGVRFRSLPLVFEDLKRFLDAEVQQVKFVDRTFNCRKSHAMAIWKFIKEHDNHKTNFHFEMAGELFDEEMTSFLQTLRPGLVQFEIGVQSTNKETLAEIDRHFSFHELSQQVKALQKKQNIHLHLDLIAGLPYEGYERFKTSFNEVYALAPHQLQLGFLKVLGGSKMKREASRYKMQYQTSAPYEVLSTQWISFDELILLHGVDDMVDHYYNSGRYQHLLEYLLHFTSLDSFSFYQKLSQHFVDESQGKPVAKLAYYEILGTFPLFLKKDITQEQQWIGKYDLLLHENAKRMPSWISVSLEEDFEEKIRAFYNTPENLITYLPEYAKKFPAQAKRGDGKHASRQTHMEVFPFHPITKDRGPVAVLFNYFSRDILGRATVTFHSLS